jgi:ribosomal protein S18 acetylase RimI-like enzyme
MDYTDPDSKLITATVADAAALGDIERACFDYDCLSAADFRHYITKANSLTLYAGTQGKPIAYGMLLFNNRLRQARLYSLAVHPQWRGKGLGDGVYKALEAAAVKRGMYTVRLEVRADNPTLQDMYGRWGFAVCGTEKGYYSDGGDAVKMKKLIAESGK